MDARSSEYGSEPIKLSQLSLAYPGPHASTLGPHPQVTQQALDSAQARIQESLAQVRDRISTRTLDLDFSTALKERWQTWSRVTRRKRYPERRCDAGSTADQQQESDDSDLDSDEDEEDDGDEGADEETEDGSDAEDSDGGKPSSSQAQSGPSRAIDATKHEEDTRPSKRMRSESTCGASPPAHPPVRSAEAWADVRRERDNVLSEMDRRIPHAFRFNSRQTGAFAERVRSRTTNMLERPFTTDQVEELIQANTMETSKLERGVRGHGAVKPGQTDTEAVASPPNAMVLSISIYWSSPRLDQGSDAEAESSGNEAKAPHASSDEGFTKPGERRGKGDGPLGMKRSQTIEVLSTDTLDAIVTSLLCWSEDQAERTGFKDRLREKALHQDSQTSANGDSDEDFDMELYQEQPNDDMRFARFTGRKRATDLCLLIEGRLYGKGAREGDEPWESDYASLLREHIPEVLDSEDETIVHGSLATRFDELPSVRVGQPYWILHQGDCVHCFVIETVRSRRPEEKPTAETAQSPALPILPSTFPRNTWLSCSAFQRFSSESQDAVGVGHRILQAQGLAFYSSKGTALATMEGTEASRARAWSVQLGRFARKNESMLKVRVGKCFACNIRKSQIGIVGGERVRIKNGGDETESVRGLDDQIVALCPQCAVMLGVAKVTSQEQDQSLKNATGEDIKIDWEALNADESRGLGWTIFPLY